MNESETTGSGSAASDVHITDELTEALTRGLPLTPRARAHLDDCRECREWAAVLNGLQHSLLAEAAAQPVSPPPALRATLFSQIGLDRAKSEQDSPVIAPAPGVAPGVPSRRGWTLFPRLVLFPRLFLGAAAVAGVLLAGTLLLPQLGQARALPDPAVVVNTGGSLLVASNGTLPGWLAGQWLAGKARLTLISGERVSATLDVPAPSSAWFTEGVRLGDRVYLADAGNDRVLEVLVQPTKVPPLRLLGSYPVSGGVAGLSAGGGRVYFKSVRGLVGLLPLGGVPGMTVSLAHEGQMPMADVMDAVLLQGDNLYVTHHLRGELCLLDPVTLTVRRRVVLGGAPVALAAVRGGLLVLDVRGRLLRLNADGRVQHTWKLPGQPDKLVLNGDRAVVTDRAGGVTETLLGSGVQTHVTLHHPMDVTVLEGGMVAVAQGQTGVALLGPDLKRVGGGDIR